MSVMANNLLAGKKGIIFGALDEQSIAWKVAERAYAEGGRFVLTNAPVAMRFGKINELAELTEEYRANGVEIERLWNKFIAQRDTLFGHIPSTDEYCDTIQQVKDWTINGLCGSCEDGIQYLEQIEGFQRTFDFKFSKEVECRVQKLRIKIWDCRYQALRELARVGSTPETRQQKLDELIEEYGIGERPEVCSPD